MIVIPRSRSSSLLSIARSATRSFARNTPLWCSSASTSVVLPWSTWAMMATLRRSGLATSALPGCDEGFSTDKDILPVYRRLLPQARQDLLRALAELLVGRDFLGERPRFGRLRQVVVRDGDVEPRRRQHAASLRDVARAPRDLLRLTLGRIVRRPNLRDLLRVAALGGLETLPRLDEHPGRARPDALLGEHDTEVVRGLAVVAVAFARQLELAARHVELAAAVRDQAGQLRHVRVDQQCVGELDVRPRLVVAFELALVQRAPVAGVADEPVRRNQHVRGRDRVDGLAQVRQRARLAEQRVDGQRLEG